MSNVWPRCRAYKVSWFGVFGVYKMGGGGGLVWFPGKHRWTKKQTKNRCLTKCLPQVLFPGPKPGHLLSLCLIDWLVWTCLTCTYPTCPGNPKGFGEENLVPGHGQDFNTLPCAARNEPKIALSNDWPRHHFVKNVGSYKMIRPTKNTPFTKWHGSLGKIPDKMPPFVTKMSSEMELGPAISLRNCDARL